MDLWTLTIKVVGHDVNTLFLNKKPSQPICAILAGSAPFVIGAVLLPTAQMVPEQ
jgi:hypothetical protein